jgi:hypothetical protein
VIDPYFAFRHFAMWKKYGRPIPVKAMQVKHALLPQWSPHDEADWANFFMARAFLSTSVISASAD